MAYPRLDPVLHLARPVVSRVAFGIAFRWKSRGVRIERGKPLNEDGILGGAVEEDYEHCCREANCEGEFVFIHSSWSEPIKNALPCKHDRELLSDTVLQMNGMGCNGLRNQMKEKSKD